MENKSKTQQFTKQEILESVNYGTCLRCKKEVKPMFDFAKDICKEHGFMCRDCQDKYLVEDERKKAFKEILTFIETERDNGNVIADNYFDAKNMVQIKTNGFSAELCLSKLMEMLKDGQTNG